jgi:two-component sensor histidine kinase
VVVGDLPQAALSDEAVQQLALLLGELQTNALKHGALTEPDGAIVLSGEREENRVALHWRETRETPVVPPERQGGGLKLLERMGSVPGGKAKVEWHPDGAAITFYLRVAQ